MKISTSIIEDRLSYFENLLEKPMPDNLDDMNKYLDQISHCNSENSKLISNLHDLKCNIEELNDPILNKQKLQTKKLLFRAKQLSGAFSSRKSAVITIVSTEKAILFSEMNNRNTI